MKYIRIMGKWLPDYIWWLESAPIINHLSIIFIGCAFLVLLFLFLPDLSASLMVIFIVGYLIPFRVLIVGTRLRRKTKRDE